MTDEEEVESGTDKKMPKKKLNSKHRSLSHGSMLRKTRSRDVLEDGSDSRPSTPIRSQSSFTLPMLDVDSDAEYESSYTTYARENNNLSYTTTSPDSKDYSSLSVSSRDSRFSTSRLSFFAGIKQRIRRRSRKGK